MYEGSDFHFSCGEDLEVLQRPSPHKDIELWSQLARTRPSTPIVIQMTMVHEKHIETPPLLLWTERWTESLRSRPAEFELPSRVVSLSKGRRRRRLFQ